MAQKTCQAQTFKRHRVEIKFYNVDTRRVVDSRRRCRRCRTDGTRHHRWHRNWKKITFIYLFCPSLLPLSLCRCKRAGFEPSISGLRDKCSTTVLLEIRLKRARGRPKSYTVSIYCEHQHWKSEFILNFCDQLALTWNLAKTGHTPHTICQRHTTYHMPYASCHILCTIWHIPLVSCYLWIQSYWQPFSAWGHDQPSINNYSESTIRMRHHAVLHSGMLLSCPHILSESRHL